MDSGLIIQEDLVRNRNGGWSLLLVEVIHDQSNLTCIKGQTNKKNKMVRRRIWSVAASSSGYIRTIPSGTFLGSRGKEIF